MKNTREKVQVDEIARELSVPRHFLSKIMKKVVKHGILDSTKGPYGGFSINDKTLQVSLYELMNIINADAKFDTCVLRLKECSESHPCPLHTRMQSPRREVFNLLNKTRMADILNGQEPGFIRSIAAD